MPVGWVILALAVGNATPATEEITPSESLERAFLFYEDLEYEQAAVASQQVLDHPTASIELRMDAYLVLGKSLAVLGRPVEAETAFRFLLRGRPDLELTTEDTPLKILRVFRSVKVEEERIRREMKELERKELISSLKLTGTVAPIIVGGDPIVFSYSLRDPRGAVEEIRVRYRKRGEPYFSALALQLDPAGSWVGEIPGAFTENESGFALEYGVAAVDDENQPLLELPGKAAPPLVVEVQPGTLADREPFWQSTWFWASVGSVVVGLGVTAAVLYSQRPELPPSQYEPVELP